MHSNGTNGNGNGHGDVVLPTTMVKSKFLSNQYDVGVVSVGFSGGQVSITPVVEMGSLRCWSDN